MAILFLDCFSSALLNGEVFSTSLSPSCNNIQMDLKEKERVGKKCPVCSCEDAGFVLSLLLDYRMKTDVSSLYCMVV